MPRFYASNLDHPSLTGEEAHHCRQVLRLKPDDELELFDGKGKAVRCRISAMNKQEIRLTALERRSTPALPLQMTLAVAVIKKNMDFIVQKATELGVTSIVPVVTERTIVRPGDGKAERWKEIALEACKQCGNNWLPEIPAAMSLNEFLSTAQKFELKLVAALRPDAKPMKSVMKPVRSVSVLVGPEGDFTTGEYAAIAAAGFLPVTLGPLVLRADTAALYALSVVHHELVTHRNVC